MPNRNYQRGRELEAKLVKHLIDRCKWPYARRTPGSKSVLDVLGITPYGVPVMFQCKSTEKDSYDLTSLLNDAKVWKLRQMPEGVRKVIVVKLGYKSNSEIHMYEWNEVKLDWIKYDDINFSTERKQLLKEISKNRKENNSK